MICIILILLVYTTGYITPETQETLVKQKKIDEIESGILKQRKSIKYGHVSWTSAYSNFINNVERKVISKREVWFDGNKRRGDFTHQPDQNQPPVREVHCQNCEKDGYSVMYTDQKLTNGIMALDLRKRNSKDVSIYLSNIDPRVFGIVPMDTANSIYLTVDSVLGLANKRNIIIQSGKWNGKDSVQYSFEFTQNLKNKKLEVIVVPSYNNAIVSLDLFYQDGLLSYHDSIKSEIQILESLRQWYPRRINYSREVDGRVQEKEEVEFHIVNFSDIPSTDIFMLSGMSINSDTPISGYTLAGKPVYWDGSKLTESGERFIETVVVSGAKSSSRTWRLLAIGFALASFSILLLYWLKRRSKETA